MRGVSGNRLDKLPSYAPSPGPAFQADGRSWRCHRLLSAGSPVKESDLPPGPPAPLMAAQAQHAGGAECRSRRPRRRRSGRLWWRQCRHRADETKALNLDIGNGGAAASPTHGEQAASSVIPCPKNARSIGYPGAKRSRGAVKTARKTAESGPVQCDLTGRTKTWPG